MAAAAFLMAKTPLAAQPWQSAPARIILPALGATKASTTATLQVPGLDLANARVVWEAQGQEPAFGTNFVLAPTNRGPQWIEVEAQWPDGRRAVGATVFGGAESGRGR